MSDTEILELARLTDDFARTHGVNDAVRHEQIVMAVYGSLGIERPSLKIDEVRAVLCGDRS